MDESGFTFVYGPNMNYIGSDEARRSLRSHLMRQALHKIRHQKRDDRMNALTSLRTLKASTNNLQCSTCSAALEITDWNPKTSLSSTTSATSISCAGDMVPNQSPKIHLGIPSLLVTGASDLVRDDSSPTNAARYGLLLDYCATCLWPGSRTSEGYPRRFFQTWVQQAAQHPVVLHALMFGASIHVDIASTRDGVLNHQYNLKEQLRHQYLAMEGIRETLSHPSRGYQVDPLLFSVLYLAVNVKLSPGNSVPDPTPFEAPLLDAQWLNIYGSRLYHFAHWEAVHSIINRHGGIHRIKAFGLAWLITLAALAGAAALLEKPPFPLIDPEGAEFVYIPPLSLLPATELPWHKFLPEKGFNQLSSIGIREEIVGIFLSLSEVSQAIQAFTEGQISTRNQDTLIDCRNMIQHRLLSMPDSSGSLGSVFLEKDLAMKESLAAVQIYEVSRLTALLYSLHVTFPLPRSHKIRQQILPMLRKTLNRIIECDQSITVKKVSRLLLWCITIGGVTSYTAREYAWYARQLLHFSRSLGVKTWVEFRELLKEFAWVEKACNTAGYAIWTEAHNGPQLSELKWKTSLQSPRRPCPTPTH